MSRVQNELLAPADALKQLVAKGLLSCPISFEPFDVGGGVVVTACGHAFGENCLNAAIEHGSDSVCKCPFCNDPLASPPFIRDSKLQEALNQLFPKSDGPLDSDACLEVIENLIFSDSGKLLTQAMLMPCGHVINECDIDEHEIIVCPDSDCDYSVLEQDISPHFLLRQMADVLKQCFVNPKTPLTHPARQLLNVIRQDNISEFHKLTQGRQVMSLRVTSYSTVLAAALDLHKPKIVKEVIKMLGKNIWHNPYLSNSQHADLVRLLMEDANYDMAIFLGVFSALCPSPEICNVLLLRFLDTHLTLLLEQGKESV